MWSITWLAAALILMAGLLLGCSDGKARSEAAETQQQSLGEIQPPFEDSLLPRLTPCNAKSALAAMSSSKGPIRAAGALCAAQSPCDATEVDLPLSNLTKDTAPAADYVNRGPMFGSGDQAVSVPVNSYALRATSQRRIRCQ